MAWLWVLYRISNRQVFSGSVSLWRQTTDARSILRSVVSKCTRDGYHIDWFHLNSPGIEFEHRPNIHSMSNSILDDRPRRKLPFMYTTIHVLWPFREIGSGCRDISNKLHYIDLSIVQQRNNSQSFPGSDEHWRATIVCQIPRRFKPDSCHLVCLSFLLREPNEQRYSRMHTSQPESTISLPDESGRFWWIAMILCESYDEQTSCLERLMHWLYYY